MCHWLTRYLKLLRIPCRLPDWANNSSIHNIISYFNNNLGNNSTNTFTTINNNSAHICWKQGLYALYWTRRMTIRLLDSSKILKITEFCHHSPARRMNNNSMRTEASKSLFSMQWNLEEARRLLSATITSRTPPPTVASPSSCNTQTWWKRRPVKQL